MVVVFVVGVLVSAMPEQPPQRRYLLPSPRGSSPQVLPAPRPRPRRPQVFNRPSGSQVPSVSAPQSLYLGAGQGLAPTSDLDNVLGLSQTPTSDPNQLQGLVLTPGSRQTTGQGFAPGQGQATGQTLISPPRPSVPGSASVPDPTLDRLYQAPRNQAAIQTPGQGTGSSPLVLPAPGPLQSDRGSTPSPALGVQQEQEPAAAQRLEVVKTAPAGEEEGPRAAAGSSVAAAQVQEPLAAGSSPDEAVDPLATSADELSVSDTLRDADQDSTSSGTTSGMVSICGLLSRANFPGTFDN